MGLSATIALGVVGAVLALGALTLFFLGRTRWLTSRAAGPGSSKELPFHSPNDAPRYFKQTGLVRSGAGTALLVAWVVFPAIGYVVVMGGTLWSYYPAAYKPFFGSWDGIMAPWLVVFILTHLLAAAVISLYSSMRMWCMRPAGSMAEATHVMIEEELPCEELDAEGAVGEEDAQPKQLRSLQRAMAAFQRALLSLGQRTLVPVQWSDGTRQISYTCVRYYFDPATDCFQPAGVASPLPTEAHSRMRAGGLSEARAAEVALACGKNEIQVPVPSIGGALLGEFMDVIYVFQSIGTWSYMVFSSWNIGIVWLFMMIASGFTRSLLITRRSKQKLAQLARLHAPCTVLRGGEWRVVDCTDVVLGDVVRIAGDSSPLPCDGILLEGSLVVNESMLTGEPMPVQKSAVADAPHETAGRKNICHAGTLALQSAGPSGHGAVMMATAVGALTTRGQLIRMVLFPSSVRFKYNDQLPLVYLIMSVYTVLLGLCYIFFTDTGSAVVTVLSMFTKMAMCVSPMLPVSMMMGQMAAARRLVGEHEIRCLQPARIPVAGKISTMVFDKTGTITKDGMDLACVVSVQAGAFGARLVLDTGKSGGPANAERLRSGATEGLRHAVASCHSVARIADGTLVGNQVEVAMVRACGWQLDQDNIVTAPGGNETLEVLRQLDFDHRRTTSGAVVRRRCTGELAVYIKGSCEKLKELMLPGSVPHDYQRTTERCARANFYTLAVASRPLPQGTPLEEIRNMCRDELEDGLCCCGLLLFRNEMKADSPEAIKRLAAGSIRSVICTGDNALTGIAIGRQSGIVGPGMVMVGDVEASTGRLMWTNPDREDAVPQYEGFPAGQLALTQASWRHLHAKPELLEAFWARVVVFARMKPEDKVAVVKYLQSRGLVVGMCGDGGNDCGALRVSHAGLALSEAEASLVSPFCTCRDGKSLITVVDLIREGRACLATNSATFQYFIVYAFCVTLSGISGTIMGNWGGAEYVWLVMDLLVGVVMVSTMTHSGPTKTLASYRPSASLLGYRTIAAIAFPVVTWAIAQTVSLELMRRHDWYMHSDPVHNLHIAPKDWPKFGDNYDSATVTCCRVVTLITMAYVSTYGGAFRCNILRNWAINLVYGLLLSCLYWMVVTTPTRLSCVFRMNCDTVAGLAAKSIPIISDYSCGGTGGCFLGPQLKLWQDAMRADAVNSTGVAAATWWIPEPAEGCLPSAQVLHKIPFDDPRISTVGCRGPNNCWSSGFKLQMVVVLSTYVIANHLFVKLVLLGPVAAWFRRRAASPPPSEVFGKGVP